MIKKKQELIDKTYIIIFIYHYIYLILYFNILYFKTSNF